jgi:hypothetical protein
MNNYWQKQMFKFPFVLHSTWPLCAKELKHVQYHEDKDGFFDLNNF